jgi:cytochrome c oxidase cbb3-type subunit IV
MDINTVRAIVTVSAMAAFVAILWWAYSPSRQQRLEAEAQRILDEADS